MFWFFFVNIIVTDYLFCGKKGNNNHRNVFVCAKTIRSLLWHATLIWRSLTSIPNIKFNLTAAIRYFDHNFYVCLFLLFSILFFLFALYDSKKKITKPIRINQTENAVIFIHWKCAVCFIDENDQNIDFFFVQSCVLLNVASVNCKWRRTNTVWCRFVCTKNIHIFTSFIWTIKIKRNNEPSFVWLYWAIGIVDREIVKLARIPIAQSDRETEALEIESTKCAANGILNSKNATFAFFHWLCFALSLSPYRRWLGIVFHLAVAINILLLDTSVLHTYFWM